MGVEHIEVAVIGAGINGLATAWNLQRMGINSVAVFEAGTVGHNGGSSHGAVRIARSTYPDAGYVRLMQRGFAEGWPALESALAKKLLQPIAGCFFGSPGGLIDEYAAGVRDTSPDVEPVTAVEARALFPGLALQGCSVLHDRTAAIIDAAGTVSGLLGLVRQRGHVYENCAVLRMESRSSGIRIETTKGIYEAQRVVNTAGPWLGRMSPVVAERLTVHRQTVGFFSAPQGQPRPGGDCVWVYVGQTDEDHFYGLPESKSLLKAAPHIRSGPGDDPDGAQLHSEEELSRLKRFVGRYICGPTVLESMDTCPYTVTESDDFIAGISPEDDRIVIGGAGSGHGFKFGPVMGQVLAELSTHGSSTLHEFVAMAAQFAPRKNS